MAKSRAAEQTGLIIFARYDSARLPGKALRPLAGRALLGWVIDRAHQVLDNLPVMVATSESLPRLDTQRGRTRLGRS